MFDILLRWVEYRDWEKSLYAVIPQRKFRLNNADAENSSQVADLPEVPNVGDPGNGHVDRIVQ